jgi:signal transduction histidine kinase
MRFDLKRLRDDLSGPWAFHPAGFLIFAPLYFIFSVLLGTQFDHPITILAAMGANVVSLSACALVFAAFFFTVFRNRLTKPVSISWLIFAGLVLGFTKGYITGVMMWALGVESNLDRAIYTRVLATSILGLLVVVTQPIMLSFRDRFRRQRDTLVVERVKLFLAPGEALQKFASLAREQMSAGGNRKPGPTRSSELLRRIIQDDLRPLSHQIWEQENARYTDFSFGALYRLAVTRYALPWKYVAPVYFLTGLGTFAPRWGLVQGLLTDLLITSAIVFVFAFAKLFVPQGTLAASLYTWFVVTIAAYLGGTGSILINHSPFDLATFTANLGNGLWILELTLSGGFITAAVKSHVEIEQELIKLVGADAARMDSEMLSSRIANRELAQYLHGHVQNQLLASAIRIEQAEAANNKEVIRQELALVDQVLATAPEGFRKGESASLTQEMRNIEELWQGLIAVNITVDAACESLQLSQNMIHDLTQASNEAVTNAMRHGFASEVKISIVPKNGILEVTATDNGTGPRNGVGGLGSALFDSLGGSKWSLTPAVGGGSVLRVKVKV